MAKSIIIENLSKCYRLGKRSKIATSGIARLLDILGYGERAKKHLAREIWALKDISLEVEEGTVLGIIGRNGAGKTTLLKVLARITPPTKGRARIRGRVVSLLEIGTGFHPEFTGRENIYLNAAIYGISKSDVNKKLDDIVSFAELENFIDTPVRHYSSGMYLRLAFSMAIHMDPDILLADEVLAVGDIAFQQKCLNRMKEVGDKGITVLFVSHDMEAINRLCNMCIRLDEGRIVDHGMPEEVTARYEKALFKSVNERTVKVKNEFAAILSVRLRSPDGKEVGALRINDDAYIEIYYNVFISEAKLYTSIDLYYRDILVFRSVPEHEFEVQTPGVYCAVVRVPGNLLAEREYYVNTGIRIRVKDKIEFLHATNVLSFRVYQADAGKENLRVVGVVRPRLQWDFYPVEERVV